MTGDKWVEKMDARWASHGTDFTTGPTDICMEIKCLPEAIDGLRSWSCADIKQHTDIGLDNRTECLEEPSMRIDFTLILFLDTK